MRCVDGASRWGRKARRGLAAAVAAMAVGCLVGALAVPASASAAMSAATAGVGAVVAPMAAGVVEAPGEVWAEDFENGQGTAPSWLATYTSATGPTYTADKYWRDYANCNGVILNYNIATWVSTGNSAVCTVEVSAVARRNAQRMADVLGQVREGAVGSTSARTPANNSSVDSKKNHAVTEWTTDGGTGTANQVVLRTVGALGATAATNRYYTASIDAVEASCNYQGGANNSRLDLLLSVGGVETSVAPTLIRACTDPRAGYFTSPAPAGAGSNPWDNGGTSVRAGRFVASGSMLLSPAQLAGASLVVRNQITASDGNDFAIDNLRLLDVTPSLDKAFAPAEISTGGVSTLTFTITNTSELAAKTDMSFTDALPAGLVVASTPAVGGTCTSTTGTALSRAATPAGSSIAVSGIDLAAGATSCTVTVAVTSTVAGVYSNGAANVTTILNAPDTATLTVTAPSTITVRKNVMARVAASDQFVLGLRTSTGTADLTTATTTGSATGVQAAATTPYTATPGQTYTIREAMASRSASALSAYTSAWQCANGTEVLSSGTGATGTVTVPAASVAGAAIVCTFTNSPLTATITVSKQVQDATGANPQPGAGWVLGAAATGATATPAATTQTTTATGSVRWQLAFANASSRAAIVVSEQQKSTHTFVSAQCDVTSITGATRTVGFAAASGGTVPGIAPGDTVTCAFVNRVKVATLTLTLTLSDTVTSGDAAPTAWTLSATGPNGALPGPSGATGSAAATAVPVTSGAAYQLNGAGGPGTYVAASGWACTDQDGAAVTVDAASKVVVSPGSQVACAIAYGTARLTLLKNVVTPSIGFTAASWTLVATPDALSGAALTPQSRVGAEFSSAGNAASTFDVRPGHGYTLSEKLTDPNSVIAYRQVALQRLENGVWVDVAAAQITAPAVGQTATYRFVNDRIPAVALPLTGGASTDGFLLAGSALLVLTGALALWQWRRRTRVHGI